MTDYARNARLIDEYGTPRENRFAVRYGPVAGNKLVHRLCCAGPPTVLCGLPYETPYVRGGPRPEKMVRFKENRPTTCVVCADIEKTVTCPQFDMCEFCVRELLSGEYVHMHNVGAPMRYWAKDSDV